MKIVYLLILFCAILSAQPMSEQEAMDESHIDFKTQYIYFVIDNDIEIDGHSFNNNDEEHIIFRADLDGITIIDTSSNVKYTHRKCNVGDCELIHLVEKGYSIPDAYEYYIKPYSLQLDGSTTEFEH